MRSSDGGCVSASLVLVSGRLCQPSSQLYLDEHYYEESALVDLLGVPAEKVNEDLRMRRSGPTTAMAR